MNQYKSHKLKQIKFCCNQMKKTDVKPLTSIYSTVATSKTLNI